MPLPAYSNRYVMECFSPGSNTKSFIKELSSFLGITDDGGGMRRGVDQMNKAAPEESPRGQTERVSDEP